MANRPNVVEGAEVAGMLFGSEPSTTLRKGRTLSGVYIGRIIYTDSKQGAGAEL